MRYIAILLLIAVSLLGFSIYKNVLSDDVSFGSGNLSIIKKNGEKIDLKVKIADTINERSQGLMYVKKMEGYDGMLFIFEDENMRKMWMENTNIPLDMLFINANKSIFNYKENATPLSREIIYSVGPALYVLELNAGSVAKYGIKPGDKIDFQVDK